MSESVPIAAPAAPTEDTVLDGAVKLRQPADGFRAAIDSVLLAAAAPVADGESVFEPGAGVGAASLCLAHRVQAVQITGIEADAALVRLAGDNIRLNGRTGQVEIMTGDVGATLPPRVAPPFDHCMINPPFLEPARGHAPADPARAAAHVEDASGLAPWIDCARRVLRHKGTLTVIHRADRLDDVLSAMAPFFGGIVVFPLWPHEGEPARRVIVRARKGVRTPLTLNAGLVLHRPGGEFTAGADAALRGAALEF
ncbi:MAG: methyltransferase [Alphaproteobacteria bacterium]